MPFLDPGTPPGAGPLHLVATLGPRSFGRAAEMAAGGATSFRVNASHLLPDAVGEAVSAARRACPEAPVVVDLQGAKMRLGWIAPRQVARGEAVRFAEGGDGGVDLPHGEIYSQVAAGDVVSVDDGRLRLEVMGAGEGWLEARALAAGTLAPRKGVNIEQHPIRLGGLTRADVEAIACGWREGARSFAFSFMSTGEEAGWVRERAPGAVVIGKVEREEALDNLASLPSLVDAIWICRGDLGAQLGPARLARAVAAIDPARHAVATLMAGQVLQHMVDHDQPSRSEICHLHDLLARGYAGIVLSDETAVGRDPVQAVRAASSLLAAVRPRAPREPRLP